ncbi:sulfatase-like hydrolase/transferase [Pseudomonas aeruginosa]|nr:sulfatase-like hydrolase/transferase [Pseudomonas aeruginosa]
MAVLLIVATIGYPFYKQLVSQGRPFDEALDQGPGAHGTGGALAIADRLPAIPPATGQHAGAVAKNAALPPLKNLVDANGDTPRTLVLVIGESTSRRHTSLYGYPRVTTPQLDVTEGANRNLTLIQQRGGVAAIYHRGAAAGANVRDQEHPDRFLTDPSLMNLMKQAGYKTFWITNQQTMTGATPC